MMDLNKYKILNKSSVRYTDRKIILDFITTNEPLYKPSEVIAYMEKAKDKRTYSTLTLIVEPRAYELSNYETLSNGILGAWDRGDFNNIGENTYLFYATLEPTASLIAKGKPKR